MVGEEGNFDPVTPGGLLAAVIAAGASTAVELALPGVPGLAAATLVFAQAASNIAGRAIEDRWQRAAGTLQHAAKFAELNLDQLTMAILAAPARTELAMTALEAAAHTRLQAKIRTLGRAIATGALAEDQALVDEQQFLVRALARLEAPHLKVLQLVSGPRVVMPGTPSQYSKTYLNWSVQDITTRYPQSGYLIDTICAEMLGAGVISPDREPAVAGEPAYRINPFGRRTLDILIEEGLALELDSDQQ
jgi:hypothetical protein